MKTASQATCRRLVVGLGFSLAVMLGSFPAFAEGERPTAKETSNRKVVFDAWTLTSGKAKDVIEFASLDPKLGYELELEFLTPGKFRIGRITAGSATLAQKVPVEATRGDGPMPSARRWAIPSSAIEGGRLKVQFEMTGAAAIAKPGAPAPFAVHVKIRASDLHAKPLTAVLPSKIEAPAIRLTPRPAAVAGLDTLKVDLGGTWKFNAAPPTDFWKLTQVPAQGWKTADVPAELAMQGLEVKGEETVAYWREFTVPERWQDNRIKLKCDAIFNDAKLWINGAEAGSHVGCFTPFELDITKLVKPGQKNVIAIAVRSDNAVDKLPWASLFAGHKLCGILRKIYLFPVPKLNVSDVHVVTTFDKDYRDGVLTAKVQIANQSDYAAEGVKLRLGLRGRNEAQGVSDPVTVQVQTIAPGHTVVQKVTMRVPSPRKWDVEHPNLYDLGVELTQGTQVLERTSQRIGFRQIEVRGNQVFINNLPVKYRGVVWHETYPWRGRSLTGDSWRKDMQLLRAMNCNYIRFQCVGAPPAEELVEACDEVGIFLEEELPVCWSSGTGRSALDVTLRSAWEMLLRDRSQPSVIQWSLGNEMCVDQNLLIAYRLFMKKLDSSRPYATDGYLTEESGHNGMPIDNLHYTPTAKVSAWANTPIPILQGEWGHPASYNRQEAYTDPGLRDIWAHGVADKWNKMVAIPGCLGGSIWCGIDDIYLMPDGTFTGWGEYGLIDTWRRPKPEYWHFKKIFSPLRITDETIAAPAAGQPLRIPVENRHSFSDLKEIRFEWSLGDTRGTATTSAPPGARAMLEIPVPSAVAGRSLTLKAYNAEGLMLDAWRIAVGNVENSRPTNSPLARDSGRGAGGEGGRQSAKVQLLRTQDRLTVRCGTTAWEIDATTGMIASVAADGQTFALHGPVLMVLPLSGESFNIISGGRMPNHQMADPMLEKWVQSPTGLTSPCTQWKATSVDVKEVSDGVEVTVAGQYNEAAGKFVLRFTGDGQVRAAYDFALNETLMQHPPTPAMAKDWLTVGIEDGKLTPRQVGLVFDVPRGMDTLAWRRRALWSYYPDDHIGRPEGIAKAMSAAPVCQNSPFYRTQPTWSWSQDCFPLGSNDFRSTKHFIYEASLSGRGTSSLGETRPREGGLRVLSDGIQHVRAWVEAEKVRLLVADVSCEGSLLRYFRERILPSPKLKPGDHVAGAARLMAYAPPSKSKPVAAASDSGKPAIDQRTHVYKKVGDLEINAEVVVNPASPTPRPVVVQIHGGALMGGGRLAKLTANNRLERQLLDAGCAIVSIDYRLAPETKLPEILRDVVDAHAWVREKGPALFGADPNRIATMGGSAGGYLTLVAGYAVSPRPRALVSFYGYGDIAGDWYSKPSPYHQPNKLVSREEAYSVVGTTPITQPPPGMLMRRLAFYTYCRQTGFWPKAVTGLDPATQDKAFDPFCPIRNVTKDYPPTLLLHGQKDTDVPCEQSIAMGAELKRVGVEHQLVTYPYGMHAFDVLWQAKSHPSESREAVDALDRAFRFLMEHLK